MVIGKGAMICAGAKVLGSDGVLHVGYGAVVSANAVLTRNTGDGEIWAGVPAKLVGKKRCEPLCNRADGCV